MIDPILVPRSSSPQVELVKAEPEHCQFLYDLYAKPQIMREAGLRVPVPAVDWRRIIQGVWDGWKDVWVIREGPVNVGHIGLQGRCDLDLRAEVSIAIDPSRQGRGIGRAALEQVLDLADHKFYLNLLIARVCADNARSLKFFDELGFTEVGRIPSYYLEVKGPVAQVTLTRLAGAPYVGKYRAPPVVAAIPRLVTSKTTVRRQPKKSTKKKGRR